METKTIRICSVCGRDKPIYAPTPLRGYGPHSMNTGAYCNYCLKQTRTIIKEVEIPEKKVFASEYWSIKNNQVEKVSPAKYTIDIPEPPKYEVKAPETPEVPLSMAESFLRQIRAQRSSGMSLATLLKMSPVPKQKRHKDKNKKRAKRNAENNKR